MTEPTKGPSTALSMNFVRGEPYLFLLPDADALRGHLHDLNEDGISPVAVGWTGAPSRQPFLITLVGCYADGEDVLFDSPWQTDIRWLDGRTHCDECRGHVHGIEHLHYPVTVMVTAPGPAAKARSAEVSPETRILCSHCGKPTRDGSTLHRTCAADPLVDGVCKHTTCGCPGAGWYGPGSRGCCMAHRALDKPRSTSGDPA